MQGNFLRGVAFFWQGILMIFSPGLRRYIILPVFINLVLFAALFGGLAYYFFEHFTLWTLNFPRWVIYILGWLFWLLYGILALLIGTFTFTLATNLVACPFYGILAEVCEKQLKGQTQDVPFSLIRIFRREIFKLVYFLPWLLVAGILFLFAPIWPILPFIVFFPLAWYVAVQYIDYCPDNQGITFKQAYRKLKEQSFTVLGFGSVVSIAMGIPGANLFVPPAAVAGGTALFLYIQSL